MDASGSYGASGKSGLAVLTHPSTTGFPQPWILRARGSMQNAVYPGRQPVAVPRDRPVILVTGRAASRRARAFRHRTPAGGIRQRAHRALNGRQRGATRRRARCPTRG